MIDAHSFGFEHAPVGLVVAHDRVIQRSNAMVQDMFGFGGDELAGQSLSLFYPSHEEFERIGAIGLDATDAGK